MAEVNEMATINNICWYCEGQSNCTDIKLYEGECGRDDTKYRFICSYCFPYINHQGGTSWTIIDT